MPRKYSLWRLERNGVAHELAGIEFAEVIQKLKQYLDDCEYQITHIQIHIGNEIRDEIHELGYEEKIFLRKLWTSNFYRAYGLYNLLEPKQRWDYEVSGNKHLNRNEKEDKVKRLKAIAKGA